MGHAQDLVHAARARIPPDGERPGGLCALTAAPTAEQRSPQAGLGALASCDQGKVTQRVSNWGERSRSHRTAHAQAHTARALGLRPMGTAPGAVRTHGDSPPTHPSPRAARARAGGTHRARAATRAGAARGPALLPYHAPVLGAPRTPAGVSGTLHAPFCLASARARGRATAPGAQLLRRGTGGLRRASFELRPSPGTPGPPHPHTECRASLCRQCAQVPPGWLGRGAPPLGKRVFYSHQGNSHKTRCEAPRCGRKHPPARA